MNVTGPRKRLARRWPNVARSLGLLRPSDVFVFDDSAHAAFRAELERMHTHAVEAMRLRPPN